MFQKALRPLFFPQPRSPWSVLFWLSLWLASAANLSLWQSLWALPELHNANGLGLGLVVGASLGCITAGLLSLLTWPGVFKPALSLVLLCAAAASYFMLSYGVVIDTPMLENTFQTDVREAAEITRNGGLFLHLAWLAGLPLVWLWRTPLRWPSRCFRKSWGACFWAYFWGCLWRNLLLSVGGFLASGLLVWSVFQGFSSLMRNHEQLRYRINPLNVFYALFDRAAQSGLSTPQPLQALGRDAHVLPRSQSDQASPPPLLLLVLGETARSDHVGLNGYARNTTPRLAQEKDLVSFTDVRSCGTSTAASVPCMFSHLGRAAFQKLQNPNQPMENVLDVLQHAGFRVLWLDNQAGCKGVCDRVAYANTSGLPPAEHPGVCTKDGCFDLVLLQGLDKRLAALEHPASTASLSATASPPPNPVGTVVVLHMMGSHGPAYSQRSPAEFKSFLPECQDVALQNCAREQVVNAYDNSIVYTDFVLSSAIAWLKQQGEKTPTGLIYLSDHGESLGEDNIYLHGMPYAIAPAAQKHVPWITWLSPALQAQSQVNLSCLQAQRHQPFSHDNYFHSVLGLLDVQTQVYRKDWDVFNSCKSPKPPSRKGQNR